MPVLVALAVARLALLTVAADQLVIGAGRLATRLGVSPVVVGVVVIGLGTSAPSSSCPGWPPPGATAASPSPTWSARTSSTSR
jgi:cation:H+ antiporter